MAGGAPKGNQNGLKGRRWTAALEKALRENNWEKLDHIARRLVKFALEEPDPSVAMKAIDYIANRLDGRPVTAVQVEDKTPVADAMEAAENRLKNLRTRAIGTALAAAVDQVEQDLPEYLQ